MMAREKKWKIYFHDLDKNKCGEWLDIITTIATNASHQEIHKKTLPLTNLTEAIHVLFLL